MHSLSRLDAGLNFGIPATPIVPAYDHHEVVLIRQRRDDTFCRTDHVLVSLHARTSTACVPSSDVITSAVPVRTRSRVLGANSFTGGLSRLARTGAIGVCSQRACHTRLGTPLYFGEIVLTKKRKKRKKRKKTQKSSKMTFLPLFHVFHTFSP